MLTHCVDENKPGTCHKHSGIQDYTHTYIHTCGLLNELFENTYNVMSLAKQNQIVGNEILPFISSRMEELPRIHGIKEN